MIFDCYLICALDDWYLPLSCARYSTGFPDISLGAVGLGLEDAMIHLLNYVWPNVFEASPAHLVNAIHEAIEGLRAALGSTTLLQYTLQVPGGPKAYETARLVVCLHVCLHVC